MAKSFRATVMADLDTSAAEAKLNALLKNRTVNIKADVSGSGTDQLSKGLRDAQSGADGLSSSLKNIAGIKIKMDALNFLKTQAQNAIRSVTELDTAMTKVSMTMSGMSNAGLNSLKNQSISMAKELSTYTRTVTDAVTIFANESESASSILKKSMPTVLLASSSGMSSSKAADAIQGIMNQFGLAEDQAMHVADVVEKLSSEIAVDFSQGTTNIAEAIAQSGSVVDEAGMSFERYAAMVSTTAERTRLSGSQIGNAFKTIFSRISRSKDGLTTDAEMSKAEEALASVGVSVRGADGDFRDISATLDDLNGVWGTLNKAQKSYVAEQAAGVRQKSIFISAMDSYNKALELEKKAYDSSGTAMEINEKRADSIQGRIEKLSATMTQVYSDAVPTVAIEGFLDFGIAVADVVDNLGLLQGAFAAIGVAGTAKVINTISSSWTGLVSALTSPIGVGSVAVGGAVAIISATVNAYKKAQEEARQAALEGAEGFNESRSSLEEYASQFENLRTQLASGTLSEMEAYQAKSQLMEMQSQLVENFGAEAEGLDLVTGAYENQIEAIRNLGKEKAQSYLTDNLDQIKKAEEEIEKERDIIVDSLAWDEDLDDLIKSKYADRGVTFGESDTGFGYKLKITGDASEAKEVITDLQTDLIKIFGEDFGSDNKGFFTTETVADTVYHSLKNSKDELSGILDSYQTIYDTAQQMRLLTDEETYSPIAGADGKTATKWLSDYAESVEDYNDAMLSGNEKMIESSRKKYQSLNDDIHKMMDNDSGFAQYADNVAEIEASLDTAAESATKFNEAINGDGDDIDKQSKSIRELTNELKDLEMTEGGFKNLARFGEGTEEGFEAVQGLLNVGKDFGYNTDDEAGLTAFTSMLLDAGVLIQEVAEDTDDASTDFKGSLKNLNDVFGDSSDGLGKAISDYKSQMNTLMDARDKWNKGEFGIEDMVNLQQEFTDLNKYNFSNFGEGIEKQMKLATGGMRDGFDAFKDEIENADPSLNRALARFSSWQQLQDALNGKSSAKNEESANKIISKAKEIGLSEENASDSIDGYVDSLKASYEESANGTGIYGRFADAIKEVGGEATPAGRALVALRDNLIGLYDDGLTFDSVGDMVDSYQTGFDKIRDIVNSQGTGKSVSAEDFASADLSDYTSALEYHNGVLQYNADKVNEIAKAKAEETKQTIASNKARAQSRYLENAREIEKLRGQLASASEEERGSIQDAINLALKENTGLAQQVTQFDLMTNAINEATSAYQNWLNAQNATQSGDMFDASLSALEKINNTLNKSDSADYGRIGNQDYKAAVDFIVPDSVDHTDADAVNSYIESMKPYLTFDSSGNADGLNIGEFCRKSVEAGLMELDSASGEYKIAGQKTMKDFADGLNLSLPMVQAMFGEMEEFGGHFDWADEAGQSMTDLAIKANEAAESLRSVKGNEDLKIVLDTTEFENKGAAIQTLESTIQQMNDLKATPGVDASQVENANSVIQYCVAQLQQLNAPAILSVDTSQITGEIGEALSLLQEFQTAKNTLEMQASVGADTSQAEASLSSLTSSIQGLSPEIKAKLNIDTSSADTIASSIEGLDIEALVKLDVDPSLIEGYTPEDIEMNAKISVDSSEVDGYQPEDKSATAKYDVDSSAPDGYQPEDKNATVTYAKDSSVPDGYRPSDKNATVNYSVNASAVSAYSPPNKSATVTYTIRTIGSPPSGGTTKVNGTAHAYGTARASGDWGTAQGGKTLVGELGREIVVDPRTGMWYTVGDNGAEFRDIPRGAIVFNHLQSESLLENGYAIGRATALATGTALVTGGIRIPPQRQQYESSHGYTPSTTSYGGSSGSGYSGGGSGGGYSGGGVSGAADTSGTSNDSKDEPDYFDWIEIKIDRIERKIESLKKVADSVFLSWTTRTKYLKDEMNAVTEEINLQYQAYNRYIAQANSIQLDEGIKALVRDGSIDIGLYDSDTQDLIKKYQEFYEKALDCNVAISDLKDTLRELYQQEFEGIATKWENTLQKYQHAAERMDSVIDRRNAYASDYMWSSTSRNASNNNIKDYRKLISNALSQRDKRTSELKELQEKLKEGLKQGRLTKNSEGYFELLKQIQEVENEIDALNRGIVDYSNNISAEYKNIFDSIANDYDNKIALAQHLSNEYNSFLELAQARGYQTSTKYYEKLRSVELQNAKKSTQLVKDLQNKLVSALRSGEIKRGSQAWYDMKERINEAIEAQQQATLAAQEYANEIRQIKWDKFDYLQEKISDITDEASFFIDLMKNENLFDDKGVITKFGKATAGLRAMNYNIDMNQADRYAKEIKAINKEIAKDPSNTDLIKRKEELIEKQRESIKAAESEKQAIKSLISDGIKKELSYIKDLISQYNNALQSQKDLYDYQKKIKDQTSEISSLQKQLSAYANDVSEETRAKLQKIRVELEEKQEDLEQTEYERMVSDTKKLLDDFYNEYETALNSRLDDIDTLIKDVINASNNSSSLISSTISSEAKSVGIQLSEEMKNIWSKDKVDPVLSVYSTNFTTKLTTINSTINNVGKTVENLWKLADEEAKARIAKEEEDRKRREAQETTAVQNSQGHGTKTATTTKKVTTTTTKKATTTKKPTTTTKKPTTTTKKPATSTASSQTLTDDIKKHVANAIWSGSYGWGLGADRVQKLTEVFGAGNGIQNIVNMGYGYVSNYTPNGYSYLEMRKKFKGYESGAKHVGKDQLAWTNENWDSGGSEVILRSSDRAVLTPLASDDRIYNAMASSRLWDAANNPSHYIAQNMPRLAAGADNHTETTVNYHLDNVTIELPNVHNYNEMLEEMQRDNKFEKMIQAMTLGRINGKPSTYKYHVNIRS